MLADPNILVNNVQNGEATLAELRTATLLHIQNLNLNHLMGNTLTLEEAIQFMTNLPMLRLLLGFIGEYNFRTMPPMLPQIIRQVFHVTHIEYDNPALSFDLQYLRQRNNSSSALNNDYIPSRITEKKPLTSNDLLSFPTIDELLESLSSKGFGSFIFYNPSR